MRTEVKKGGTGKFAVIQRVCDSCVGLGKSSK